MNRRQFFKISGLTALGAALFGKAAKGVRVPKPKNKKPKRNYHVEAYYDRTLISRLPKKGKVIKWRRYSPSFKPLGGSLSEYIEILKSKGKTDFSMLSGEEKAEFDRRVKELLKI